MERFTLPEQLQTERLLLQRLRYEDAEEIFYTYASKPEATQFVSFPTHQRIRDTHQFLQYAMQAWEQGTDFTYAIRLKASGKLAGTIGVVHENGKVQVGYILSPTHWGNGYATEACGVITSELKKSTQLFRISSFVDCDNHVSARVLEKCGYRREATLLNWMRFPNQQNKPKDCWVYVCI